MTNNWNKYLVEFLGTLFITYIIFLTGNYLAIGSALAIAILIGGTISGGAFNPAIAIAMFYKGQITSGDLIPYILAQILGASVAAAILI
jgi:aquaporin Z